MLCDYKSGYSSAKCYNAARCSGALNNNCNPNSVWNGTTSGDSAYIHVFSDGAFSGPALWGKNLAFSARCVSDL